MINFTVFSIGLSGHFSNLVHYDFVYKLRYQKDKIHTNKGWNSFQHHDWHQDIQSVMPDSNGPFAMKMLSTCHVSEYDLCFLIEIVCQWKLFAKNNLKLTFCRKRSCLRCESAQRKMAQKRSSFKKMRMCDLTNAIYILIIIENCNI